MRLTDLFNPRESVWERHFRWMDDHQTIEGITVIGRATVATLDMNSNLRREARKYWFELRLLS